MKTKRWIMSCTIASAIMLSPAQFPAEAEAAAAVKVDLPTYAVNIDGKRIDNLSLAYPLLNYKGVTYFPLTWNVGAGLGLGIHWSAENGLDVRSHGVNQTELAMEKGEVNTQASYTAQIAAFPVTIDGIRIRNEQEPFPLVVFRDVTYFPMTWDYTVNKFGWKTSWDERSGFSIYTRQQSLEWDRLIYDDEQFLFAAGRFNGSSVLIKIRKDFQGAPELLTAEEAEKIRQLAYPAPETEQPKVTKRVEDKVYYEGIELLDLRQHMRNHPELYDPSNPQIDYSERIAELASGIKVVNLAFMTHRASVANDPDTHTYLINGEKAMEIEGFDQKIYGTEAGTNGIWLWSLSPTESGPRTSGSVGKALWLNDQGHSQLWNTTLKAEQLRVIQARQDELIVQAYGIKNALPASQAYFRITSDGRFEKIADSGGVHGYADRQGNIYELRGPNHIKNVTQNTDRAWTDDELKQ